jgi:hypothetical protein
MAVVYRHGGIAFEERRFDHQQIGVTDMLR